MPSTAADPFTLAVDCGGGGIKASVLDAAGTLHAPAVRVPTPYPLPPDRLVETIAQIADGLPRADRVTVGMPGMIRHGVVVSTPHYVTRSGPRTAVDPEFVEAWSGCDVRAAVQARLGLPTLVLNDAEVHGAGVVSGTGVELVLTLGTGLGSALFDGGALAPHLELSHAPVRWGMPYDLYIGQVERARLGDGLWSRRVRRVVEGLRPVFLWDRLYLGGGNARQVTPQVLDRLGDDVVVVPNQAGIVGGVRAWNLGLRPPTA
ncbi:putative polyphosphate glucokinase PpgK [Cellulomonas chitinilytica]|uniref:Polyphosphate glucokinase PpgK n=1 Tax=Cellulomonas chitinilytica TaxID=398759 RepID=A0A919P0X2_9CELL|nr:ROK family protein [Cellulomonas chitinilytica]GIG19474.1 putative polyphosphate glucokinase PpgK [Cellulomonas chitinilytica]